VIAEDIQNYRPKNQRRFFHNFNLSCNAKATCTRAIIKVVNHHRQEYQHQYGMEKQPNNPVDIVGEPRVQITIVEDATVKNIARTNILMATMKKDPRSIWQSKI
jgi:hypothetical protein